MGFLSDAGLGCILEGHINNKVGFVKVFLIESATRIAYGIFIAGSYEGGFEIKKPERSHIPI
jgi:hypothetical protein